MNTFILAALVLVCVLASLLETAEGTFGIQQRWGTRYGGSYKYGGGYWRGGGSRSKRSSKSKHSGSKSKHKSSKSSKSSKSKSSKSSSKSSRSSRSSSSSSGSRERPINPPPRPVSGCTIDGKFYKEGQSIGFNPCRPCVCNRGRKICAAVDCFNSFQKLPCTNPIRKTGECCLSCPSVPASCVYGGKVIKPGTTVPDKGDPCVLVTCTQDGQILRAAMSCPTPTCAHYCRIPGVCCPVCTDVPDNSCLYQGRRIPHGTLVDVKNWCRPVECRYGELVYPRISCPIVHCSNPFVPEGSCCPCCGIHGGVPPRPQVHPYGK